MVELIEQIKYNLYFAYSNKNRNPVDCGMYRVINKTYTITCFYDLGIWLSQLLDSKIVLVELVQRVW